LLMNRLTVRAWAVIDPGLRSAWRIDGIGDLDGDGKADLVFRNTETGDVAAWLMNGLTVRGWAVIDHGLSSLWQIQ
jgi:FG-GAP repeat protein